MKIRIDYINDNIVQFSSDYGVGKGKWTDVKPQLKREYYVEFEIRDILAICDFSEAAPEKCFIEANNENNLLTARLIDYEDTGCASFIFGDIILDIETKFDNNFIKLINKYLSFQVTDLYIYSINI